MTIEDARTVSFSIPAVEIVQAIVSCLPKERLAGIRKIWLFDYDYEPRPDGRRRAGQYVPVKGTRMADVELFIQNQIDGSPAELRSNRLFLTWLFAGTLAHELFHHLVRGQQATSRPTAKAEEAKARRAADSEARRIMLTLFPLEIHRAEHENVKRILDEAGWGASDES